MKFIELEKLTDLIHDIPLKDLKCMLIAPEDVYNVIYNMPTLNEAEGVARLLTEQYNIGYEKAKFQYKTRKGHWIPKKILFPLAVNENELIKKYYICSECEESGTFWSVQTNFCPNCGADMRGIDNG